MSTAKPISESKGGVGILFICAAINILVAVILMATGRGMGALTSLAMGLIFMGWARSVKNATEIIELLGGADTEAMMRHAQRLEHETEALRKRTDEALAKYVALLARVDGYEARLEEELRVERAIRKAVEAERDELRRRLDNSTTMGLN